MTDTYDDSDSTAARTIRLVKASSVEALADFLQEIYDTPTTDPRYIPGLALAVAYARAKVEELER